MWRNRLLSCKALTVIAIFVLPWSCTWLLWSCAWLQETEGEGPEPVTGDIGGRKDEGEWTRVMLAFDEGGFQTKSQAPDETSISDVNIFIFDSDGFLAERHYVTEEMLEWSGSGLPAYPVKMLHGRACSIYVCANMGFGMQCRTLEEVLSYRFHMAYPDDYSVGMPMSGSVTEIEYDGSEEIVVPLKRAMAKICLSIDRSLLDEDVDFNVIRAQVGNCPRSVSMFGKNSVESPDDVHASGFYLDESQVYALNRSAEGQTSGEVGLYLLENMQGTPLGEIGDYEHKVFPEGDALMGRCSYIELTIDYLSEDYYSLPAGGLVYRFYLGESPSDFNVERNCRYHITVRPNGSGLDGSSWRVDKSGLGYCGPISMEVTPGTYIRGDIGDEVHVRCELVPDFTPLDIGLDELEYDKERGIYDYKLDEDGHGVVLTLTGSGRGLLYFEAGDPVDDAALVVIEVNLP